MTMAAVCFQALRSVSRCSSARLRSPTRGQLAPRGLWAWKTGFRSSAALLLADEKDLERAKARVLTLSEDPGNDAKLKLYGLFKQATEGPCTKQKPGAFDFVGKAKWNAWNSLGDMSKSDAIENYCSYVDELVGEGGKEKEKEAAPGPATSSSSSEDIVISDKAGVRTITLNRPKKYNAITWQMYTDVQNALRAAGEDGSVRVALLTGAGDYFCSGNDLSNFAKIPPEGPQKLAAQGRAVLQDFVAEFIRFPKPLVVAVNGPAVGISVTLLGLCDLVYAAEHATFHTPFMQLGQSPEACSSYTFPRIMGPAKANEVLIGGRKLTAVEALERCLVTRVFAREEFQQKVEEAVAELAKMPPQSVLKSKELIRRVEVEVLEEVNRRECELLEERWLSEECMRAIMDFMQRRK